MPNRVYLVGNNSYSGLFRWIEHLLLCISYCKVNKKNVSGSVVKNKVVY